MNFKENESTTKLRGGYYTPAPIAKFLSQWVLNTNPRSVLEPSCGDGAFIRAFSKLHHHNIAFTGVELLTEEAVKARKYAKGNKRFVSKIYNCNFLKWAMERLRAGETFDAAVGNPPYIRYQYLDECDQELSKQIFGLYQLPFTKHTNAWVPFVIASIGLLSPGGRLAMVVPSELIHVLHAGALRKFLLSECSRILIIDPNELLFKEALQGTVLLMVEKKISSNQASEGVAIVSAPNNDFLTTNPDVIYNQATYTSGDVLNGKWMKLLLKPHELMVFERVLRMPTIKRFSDIASVDVGIVTGANSFFLVDDLTINKYSLQDFAHPMFGRSEHCPGVVYTKKVHKRNAGLGLPTNFVKFDKAPFKKLPHGAQTYIGLGEDLKLHKRYKCSNRDPWYYVPSVYATNLGMLKRAHNYPRLILNKAKAYTTDTAYRIRTSLDPTNIVYNFINSLTALSAELEGRHYGGGVLELVPSEIEKLIIPVIAIGHANLNSLDAEIGSTHNTDTLFAKQDAIVLTAAGLTHTESELIHEAWIRVRSRRHRLIGEVQVLSREME